MVLSSTGNAAPPIAQNATPPYLPGWAHRRGETMKQQTDMDQLAVNTIRMLAVDAVQKAKS